jgi:hypothetical protein
VPVELADELAAVGVPERDRDVLGGQLEQVDHVPAREMPSGEVEAPLPPRRRPDRLPVVGARRSSPVAAADRREAELPFDWQREDRLARGLGQRRLPRLAVLRQREGAGHSTELLNHPDAGASEIDVDPAQRIQLARPQARERSDLEPSGKRWARQLARAADQLPDLLLARRLLVPAARPTRYPDRANGF